MADVAHQRVAIEATGTQVAFVHMSEEEEADEWLGKFDLADVLRISDPKKALYRQFGLEDGTVSELVHPRVWLPWLRTAILKGRGAGAAGTNWRQLTGVFVIYRGRILTSVRHRNSAARPDYVALAHAARSGAIVTSGMPAESWYSK